MASVTAIITIIVIKVKHNRYNEDDQIANMSDSSGVTADEEDDEEIVFGIDKAKPKISSEQFYEIKELSTILHSIITQLGKSNLLLYKINEKSRESGGDTLKLSEGFENYPLVSLSKDLRRCYEEMGHPYDATTATAEGQALFVIVNNIQKTRFVEDTAWEFFNYLTSDDRRRFKLLKKFFNLISGDFSGITIKSDLPEVAAMLVLIEDFDTADKYLITLYRLASIIAKIDGTVTEKEKKWLKDLSSLIKRESTASSLGEIVDVYEPVKELDSLIGLESVKTEVRNISNFIAIRNKRIEAGLPVPPVSYHCVFTGNPGTGKTTVARILAGIYKQNGVLKKGHLIETDRSGLVAEYVGQTAVKTNNVIDKALDGVLFIDEAYTLAGSSNDYGPEAIATLLKRMEDDRDRLIVIVAGYTDEINEFISSNPGLRSRFTRYIHFPDYTADELCQIFMRNADKNKYVLTEEAKFVLTKALDEQSQKKSAESGNARFVRNLFEKIITQQANRLASVPLISAELLSTIEADDILNALK